MEMRSPGIGSWGSFVSIHPAPVVPGILALPNLSRATEELKGYRISEEFNKQGAGSPSEPRKRHLESWSKERVATGSTLDMDSRHPGPNKTGDQAGKEPQFHGAGQISSWGT